MRVWTVWSGRNFCSTHPHIQEVSMAEAYIVSAVRTAGGRRNGRLSGWHPADLAAQVINALIDRSGADPAIVDDVIMGCVSQIGEQSTNVARTAVLASKLPISVPGTTVDRQCGSSQQALHFASQAVMSGTMDVVIAAGVEVMSRVPLGSANLVAIKSGMGDYISPRVRERYDYQEFSQFEGAELIAKKYGLSRDQLDLFALQSHERAIEATRAGSFSEEIIPVPVIVPGAEDAADQDMHIRDEGVRFDVSLEGISSVKLLQEGGRISAASASQVCDGASGVIVVSERGLKLLGVKPLARVHHISVLGDDPVIMLEAPIPATRRALDKAGMKISDIDLYEVNEAFAPMAGRSLLDILWALRVPN
jgi:acetyl-CoA C-acetyltransferase